MSIIWFGKLAMLASLVFVSYLDFTSFMKKVNQVTQSLIKEQQSMSFSLTLSHSLITLKVVASINTASSLALFHIEGILSSPSLRCHESLPAPAVDSFSSDYASSPERSSIVGDIPRRRRRSTSPSASRCNRRDTPYDCSCKIMDVCICLLFVCCVVARCILYIQNQLHTLLKVTM